MISPLAAPSQEGIANQVPKIGQLAVAAMLISWLPDSQVGTCRLLTATPMRNPQLSLSCSADAFRVETSRLVTATLMRNPQLSLLCSAAAFRVGTSVALWELPLENLKYREEEPLEAVAVFARPVSESVELDWAGQRVSESAESLDWAGLPARELRQRLGRAALWGPVG